MKTGKATAILPLGLLMILGLVVAHPMQSELNNLNLRVSGGVQRLDDENIDRAITSLSLKTSEAVLSEKKLEQNQINLGAQRAIANDEMNPDSIIEENPTTEEELEEVAVWQLYKVDLVTPKKVIKSGESKNDFISLLESSGAISGILEINKDYPNEEGRNEIAITLKANLNGKEFVLGPVLKKGQDLYDDESETKSVSLATLVEGSNQTKIYITSGIYQGSLFIFCKDLISCQEQEESSLDSDGSVENEEPFIDESSDQENED